ncbi:MAG: hypothetical protein NTX52_11430 [Planctomycetota bacterium]|nr:hypothetical protein [Planctomycetota bacterium]
MAITSFVGVTILLIISLCSLCPLWQKIHTPGGRRVFMHDVIMGLDTLEDESLN